MAVPYYGDFPEDDTVNLPFNTFDSNDPSASVTATDLVDSDIFVHKDGSATAITTDGATIDIDAPGVGAHMITIDTSVDAAYATGSEYAVRVDGVTVDGGTVNAWIGAFSIERAGGALALIKAGVTLAAGAVTDASLAGGLEIVFETDFGTNYNTTRNAWATNYTDIIGVVPIVTYGLDHLVFTSVADEVADDSIIAKMVDASSTADWSVFVSSEDSLRAISEKVSGIGSATGGGFNFAPVASNAISVSINNGGAAVDKSTSPATVGIPVTGHAFLAGHEVTISATVAYNGTFQIDSVSTNEVVIVSSFTSETFGADDIIKGSIKATTIEGVETTNTFAVAGAQDGVYHVIDDDGADNFTIAYRFEVGGDRIATEAVFTGFLNSGNDDALIQAYDFVGSVWETRRQLDGQNGSVNQTITVPLLARNTGTDATDLGNVFLRITDGASSSNPTLNTDSLLVEAQGVGQTAGYQNGQIWFDSVDGTDAAEKFVNGTSDKPVKTELNVEALIATGLSPDIHVLNGSTYTLASSAAGYSFFGDNWTLVLNNQACGGAHFEGAEFSGIQTGANCGFTGGEAGDITVADDAHIHGVGLSGTITLPVGAIELINCHHDGATAPILEFGAAVGSTTVHAHGYHGAIEVQNMGDSGTDVLHLDGEGTLTVNANCSGGTIHRRGMWKVNNLSGGAVTINDDDLSSGIIYGDAETGTLSTTQCTSSLVGYTDEQLIGRVIIFYEGPADGEGTEIKDYASSNGLLTFTALKLAPENGNAFKIV